MSEPIAAPPEPLRAGTAPEIETEPVLGCAVCGDQRFRAYTTGYDYELLTCSNPWTFVQCENCAHVWLHPRPAISTLRVIYPPTYYAYNYAEQIHPIARWGKETLDRLKFCGIVGSLSRPPASYLDIGCGDGRFLRLLERRGLRRERLYGLELDQSVVSRLTAQGYRVFCQRVEDCGEIPAGSIDLATMFHVIEHLEDPGLVIRQIAGWLAPGGVLALETPNLDSLDARLFREHYWGGYHFPRHWHLFSPPTLYRLLEAGGLRVIATRYQTGHSFWMFSMQHRLRYGPRPRPRLSRLFNPLQSLAVLVAVSGFDQLRAGLGFRTSAMLVLARKL